MNLKDPLYILIILILLALVGFQSWHAGREKERRLNENIHYQSMIEQQRAKILTRDSLIQAMKVKVVKDSTEFKVAVIARNEEIKGYKKTIARLRPLVNEKIDSFPDLRAFVTAQDSVITKQDSLIRHQDRFFTAQVHSLSEIIALTEQNYQSQKEITSQVTTQLASVDKKLRKEHRRKGFWKATTAIVTGVALYLAVKPD